MTLPVSGAISLSDVNVELQRSATATISMSDAELRTLFAVPSGAIGLANGFGKANKFTISITSNQLNLDLRPWLVSQGWNQNSKAEVTINSGVYLYSNSTSIAGLRISGSFPNGLTIINNGYIVGQGGSGTGNSSYSGASGGTGGAGLQTSTALTMVNNGTIGGGGGGGGGGGAARVNNHTNNVVTPAVAVGGTGGAGRGINAAVGGGGGAAVSKKTAEYNQYYQTLYGGAGGSGGNWGTNGSGGGAGYKSGNTDPGYAAYGGGSGGSGGACVQGNGYITWSATGTRYGSLT